MLYKVGSVLSLKTDLKYRSRKFGIVIVVSESIVFYVNSAYREYQDPIPYPHTAGDRFPYHDSFIGCGNTFKFDPRTDVEKIVGEVSKELLHEILVKVKASKRIQEPEKIKIIAAISEEIGDEIPTP
jgi:hypothetical protein